MLIKPLSWVLWVLVVIAVTFGAVTIANAHHGGGDGDSGPNRIVGTSGDDKLVGGHGPDILIGKAGDDRLWGGRGPDVFRCGQGYDVVNTRAPGAEENDTIGANCEELRTGTGPGPG